MAFDPAYPHKITRSQAKWHSRLPAAGFVTTFKTRSALYAANINFGGQFKVVGTVKYKNTPINTPLRRRVFLLREPDMRLVATSWSDATTGAYSFTGIAGTCTYTVLSVDYAHNYRAVVADNLAPEAM